MSRRRIQRFQAGQTVISAVRLNEIVDALNELMPVQGDGKLIGVEQRGVGGTTIKWTGPTVDSLGGFEAVIDTDGYDDFTGPTYWVKEAYCSNAARVGGNVASGASAAATVASSANDVLQLKGKDSATGRRVVATNMTEIANPTSSTPTGSHTLVPGLPVRVWVTRSLSPDGTAQVSHYYFWSGGQKAMFDVAVEKTGGDDGTATGPATYVYTLRSVLSTTVLQTFTPQVKPRPWGKTTFQAGTTGIGVAYYESGVLFLWDAGERPTVLACST